MADLQVWLDGLVLELEAAKEVATDHGKIKDLSFRKLDPSGKRIQIIIENDNSEVTVNLETS